MQFDHLKRRKFITLLGGAARRSMRCVGELDRSAFVHALVHLAAQLVFSSDMIASHRFTKSDHCSTESAFTSAKLASSALSRLAVAR